MSVTETAKHYPRAIAMLIGTIIGVGIFGVPYVVTRSGALIGVIHFLVITAALLFVHLSFGELALRTQAHHRLVGYAERYFGRWGKGVAALAGVAGIYGALLAYIIIGGSFLHQLFGSTLGGTAWSYSIAFSAFGLLVVAFGLRMIEELEFILTAFLFIVMALIFIVGAQRVNPEHWQTVSLTNAFLPYGAILFSLSGASAIAEIRDILRGRERLLARAITWGTLIAAALTAAFVFIVVGVSGPGTTSEAIAGLAPTLGRSIVVLGALLGILAIVTSFLSLGLYLTEVFRYDFRRSKPTALLLAIVVPIAIFLLGQPGFTSVIIITGGIFGGLDGIIILATVLRARRMGDRKPEFALRVPAVVHGIVALMFLVGIAVTIWETVRGF